MHLPLKTFMAGMKETKVELLWRMVFTIMNWIIVMHWLSVMFIFSYNFNKKVSNDICYCFLLNILQKCDIALSLNICQASCCYTLSRIIPKKFCGFPHFTYFPNLICIERLFCLFSLYRWDLLYILLIETLEGAGTKRERTIGSVVTQWHLLSHTTHLSS